MNNNTLQSAFEPYTLGPITLRNRFIKAGANENMSYRGVPTAAMLRHHVELAEGGVGMSTMAYIAVEKTGRTLKDQIWLHPEAVTELKAVTDAVHAAGGKLPPRLPMAGRLSRGYSYPGAC